MDFKFVKKGIVIATLIGAVLIPVEQIAAAEGTNLFELAKEEKASQIDQNCLMNAVAEVRGETVNGVPYIVVGNQSWNGFDENVGKEILAKSKEEYKAEERYDVMDYVDEAALVKGPAKDDSIATGELFMHLWNIAKQQNK